MSHHHCPDPGVFWYSFIFSLYWSALDHSAAAPSYRLQFYTFASRLGSIKPISQFVFYNSGRPFAVMANMRSFFWDLKVLHILFGSGFFNPLVVFFSSRRKIHLFSIFCLGMIFLRYDVSRFPFHSLSQIDTNTHTHLHTRTHSSSDPYTHSNSLPLFFTHRRSTHSPSTLFSTKTDRHRQTDTQTPTLFISLSPPHSLFPSCFPFILF